VRRARFRPSVFLMKPSLDVLNSYHEKGLLSKNKHPYLPLFIWNYTPKTQYERLWDDITILCRALVTDTDGNIVARSFKKFFNIEEETNIPNEPFNVYEKLDGSLILVFYFQNELVVASRGSFCSDHSVEAKNILEETNVECLDKNNSYSFELIVPWNKIVCDYGNQRKLVLLAKFDSLGNEYDTTEYESFFQLPKTLEFKDLNYIKGEIPDNEEGYVIRFKSGKRVKVKSERYVAAHRFVSSFSEKFVLEVLASKKDFHDAFSLLPDEFYSAAREMKSKIERRFEEIIAQCKSSFVRFDSRKESAEHFKKQEYPQVLFAMLDNRNVDDIIWKIIKSEIKGEL